MNKPLTEVLLDFIQQTGFAHLTWQQAVMIGVSGILIYLAIKKKYEPLLLLPIAFGMLLTNLPLAGLMDGPIIEDGEVQQIGGLLHYLYQGIKLGIFPPLIFLGIGTMTDFGPLLANPKSFFLGAAAQLGVFMAFFLALFLGFSGPEAASIGIIGGADGPTAIYVTSLLAPELLGPVAVAAYSYMALIPIIQPPIMKGLTTKAERQIEMEQLRTVSKLERILFPIIVTILGALLVPSTTALLGMLMLGNLFRESLVVDRLSKTAQNELMNIITIFLGVTVGATANAELFLTLSTIKIIVLGLVAFAFSTAGGVLFGKLMCKLSGGRLIHLSVRLVFQQYQWQLEFHRL